MPSIRETYAEKLRNDILPYWRRHEDDEFGGVLNCLDSSGEFRLRDDKFSWSQGRYLWVLARQYALQEKGLDLGRDQADLRAAMDKTFTFLVDKAVSPEFRCRPLLSRCGEPRTTCAESIYADCYVLSGLAEHVRATGQPGLVPRLDNLYGGIAWRAAQNTVPTAPYAIPSGYRVHDFFMTLVNTVADYIEARRCLGMDAREAVDFTRSNVEAILDLLWRDGVIREYVSDEAHYRTRLLDRHLNPGHMLESMWFCAEFLEQNDTGILARHRERIVETALAAFEIGWDNECGGLLRFVDREGGPPRGHLFGDSFEEQIRDGWSLKLWWVHAEALFSLLYLYSLSGDRRLVERYERLAEYVFRVFPNSRLGEWIQTRLRDGTPENKHVALPVKDPFHIARSFLKILTIR